MEKIKNSLKQRPINGVLMAAAALLYLLNNLVFKNIDQPILHEFFAGYFNDLMCPLFILPYSNMLLLTVDKELKKLPYILLLCLGGSVIWELLAPLYKEGSVRDVWDVACYLFGGLLYWILLKAAYSCKKVKIDEDISQK